MPTAELVRRVAQAIAYPPLCDASAEQSGELHDALLEAETFQDLPGKWQAAILEAEARRGPTS